MSEQQAKALFFAQYLGQIVFQYCNGGTLVAVYPNILKGITTENHLLLRMVDQLNPDQLLKVGIVAFPMFVPFPEKDHDTLRKLALTVLDRGHLSWVTRQTLIGYGVLVPFIYINEENKPVILQPEDITSKGWAKITQ